MVRFGIEVVLRKRDENGNENENESDERRTTTVAKRGGPPVTSDGSEVRRLAFIWSRGSVCKHGAIPPPAEEV